MRPALLLALLLLAGLLPPVGAAATRTISDLEEPVLATDEVLEVQVTPEEAGQARIVVFLNDPGKPFGLTVYRPNGSAAFERTGTRGVQPLAVLDEGLHKVHVRGPGAFQVTNRSLDRLGSRDVVTEANATLRGADAWVVAPTRPWNLHVEGNVSVELRDLGGVTREHAPPVAVPLNQGAAYVLTLRGEDGTPYRVRLEALETPTPTPGAAPTGDVAEHPPTETPGPTFLALVAVGLGVGLLMRRRA